MQLLSVRHFSGLDHTGSIPDERQDCVWVHRLLVRPTPSIPLVSLFLMPLLLARSSLLPS